MTVAVRKELQDFMGLENHDDKSFSAFELSKNCKYWSWSVVSKFLSRYRFAKYSFHGCSLGIKGSNGLPMQKGCQLPQTSNNSQNLSNADATEHTSMTKGEVKR